MPRLPKPLTKRLPMGYNSLMAIRKRPPTDYSVEDSLHNHWIDVESRELWLRGVDTAIEDEPGIEYMCATRTNMNLNLLRREGNDPVILHMQTCGGSYTEGMAIYDTIRSMPYHVTIVCYSPAESISSVILQAANLRLMMPNSYIMVHPLQLQVEGDIYSVQEELKRCIVENETLQEILISKMKTSMRYKNTLEDKYAIAKDMQRIVRGETYMSPKAAIYHNLADGIVTGWENGKVTYE